MKIWRLGKRLHHHGVTVEEEALLGITVYVHINRLPSHCSSRAPAPGVS